MSGNVVPFLPTAKTGERRERVSELEAQVATLQADLAESRKLLQYHESLMSEGQTHRFAYAMGAFEFYKWWRAGQIANGRKSLPISYWDLPYDEQLVYIAGVHKVLQLFAKELQGGIQMGLHHE